MKGKEISPIVIDHWNIKFEKSVKILLDSGISSDELINKMKIIENKNKEDEKNSKN